MTSIPWMLSAVLVAAIGSPAIATPDRSAPPELATTREQPRVLIEARSRVHLDSTRVAYHAAEAQIARRDLGVADFEVDRTRRFWDRAVAGGHPVPAGYWAVKHADALADWKEAMGRWLDERAERNLALADLRADWDQLERSGVASHRES